MIERYLAQLAPTNTALYSLVSPEVNQSLIVTSLIVCNTGSSTIKYRVHYDDDGGSGAAGTALMYETPLGVGQSDHLELKIVCANPEGSLMVQVDTPNSCTFTAFGLESGVVNQ